MRLDGRGLIRETRRRRVSVIAPVVCASGLTLAALALIVTLIWHATDSRDAQDTVGDVAITFNELQTVPWNLLTRTATSPVYVRAEMSYDEQAIAAELGRLGGPPPTPALTRLPALLNRNFALLGELLSSIERHRPGASLPIATASFQNHDAVARILAGAGASYLDRARSALQQAEIGSAAVVLVLLLGFVFCYQRAFRARSAAEGLAAQLRHSEAHLELAQQVSGVGSWEWSVTDCTAVWSSQMVRLHAWTQPEPPPTLDGFLELVDQADRPVVRAALCAVAGEGTPLSLEYHVTTPAGSRLIHLRGRRIESADGRRRALIGTCQDVTDRFRRAEAERANHAKDEFISRMSHELRTPLNAIIGFSQLMSVSDLDRKQQSNVAHVLTAGRHLLELINELLDIAQIESGELRVSLAAVELAEVVGEAIELVEPIAAARNVSVTVQPLNHALTVRADAQRLRQVLLNLLANAVKYNQPGGHAVVRCSPSDDDRVSIHVTDDGPGISSERMELLFSPFERLGAERTRVEGTGLGLAVSRGMVEAMGGTIDARSRVGWGTTFAIELEAERDRGEPSGIDPRQAPV